MSEQIKPCLRNFVEAVDAGEQILPGASEASKLGLQYGTLHELEHGNFQEVKCLGCTALAEINTKEPQKVEFTTYEDMYQDGTMCATLNAGISELPRMTDDFACLATATTYALRTFGVNHPSTAEIDGWLGRKPGEFYPPEGFTNYSLALLQAGYALENVFLGNEIKMSDFYEEGSTLTYADFVEQMVVRHPKAKAWLESPTGEEDFNVRVKLLRVEAAKLKPYESSGQFINTRENVTVESIAQRLTNAKLLADMRFYDMARHTDVHHAVVVENIAATNHGEVVTTYFNPGFRLPSRYSVRRRDTIEDTFVMEQGLTFIKPFIK